MISRLQKKCLLAATGLHAILVSAAFVGPAFLGEKKSPPQERDPITFVNVRPTDGQTRNAGNPNVTEMPAKLAVAPAPAPAPAELPPPPAPQPVQAKPEPPAPEPEPEKEEAPSEVKEAKIEKPDDFSIRSKNKPKPTLATAKVTPSMERRPTTKNTSKTAAPASSSKINVNINTPMVRRPVTTGQTSPNGTGTGNGRANGDTRNKQYAALGDSIGGSIGNIRGTASGGTAVEMPGMVGMATANYNSLVREIYYRAWLPEDTDVTANVFAEIIVDRSGRILSSKIVRSSGIGPVDRSVQKALNRVTQLPSFPPESKDSRRTFKINFDPKSKNLVG